MGKDQIVMLRPELLYDEQTLRDYSNDPEAVRAFLVDLKTQFEASSDISQQVSLLGEMGVYLRVLGELDTAEAKLQEALRLIEENGLGLKKDVQQKIRLAHVYQWQKNFTKSDAFFVEILSICRSDEDAEVYLDFALQHAGKNFFDQERYAEALECFSKTLTLREGRKAPPDQIESTQQALREVKRRLGI